VSEDRALIDDRSAACPALWRFFTDAVMGGVSTGRMSEEPVAGRAALCLLGSVSTENRGGFIQMALDVPAPTGGPWRGIELDVLGNGLSYGLHLRTSDMILPWQSWRARFATTPSWQTVQLPFERFEPYRTSGRLAPAAIRRLGILALGEPMEARVCVARLAWLR
jgi:hypothetical protein